MAIRLRSMDFKDYIRNVPDFPSPGILFRDITPLLKNPAVFCEAIDRMADHYESLEFDTIIGIDARGFLLSAPLAYRLGKSLVPVRKEGKLPPEIRKATYHLEYGTDVLEVKSEALASGQRVVIVDDLLATGGTVMATSTLVEQAGARVSGVGVLIELTYLGGRASLDGYDVFSLVKY